MGYTQIQGAIVIIFLTVKEGQAARNEWMEQEKQLQSLGQRRSEEQRMGAWGMQPSGLSDSSVSSLVYRRGSFRFRHTSPGQTA